MISGFQRIVLGAVFMLIPGAYFSLGAQCTVVINEILINGPGDCDGVCNPNTEEWLELFNPCDVPADLSCWVLGDGDYTVTFPPGTQIAAGGYFVIGSLNSGPQVDLFLGSCACAVGSLIGTFTNSNEQVLLFDDQGNIQDAIYWGVGQFPVNIASPAAFGCPSVTYSASQPDASVFEQIPGGGANGCTIARTCDGSDQWEQRCGTTVSQGASNGAPLIPAFSASTVQVCPGDCVSFQYTGSGQPDSYAWSFSGSELPSSADASPPGICYQEGGTFGVSLTVTDNCGSATVEQEAFIQVDNGIIPQIAGESPVLLCSGETAWLEAIAGGEVQWYADGEELTGETGAMLQVSASRSYSVSVNGQFCELFSDPVEVSVALPDPPALEPAGPAVLCPGSAFSVQAEQGYDSYQWLLDGVPLSDADGVSAELTLPGEYEVAVTSAGCPDTSGVLVLIPGELPVLIYEGESPLLLCNGTTEWVEVTTDASTLEWLVNDLFIPDQTAAGMMISESGNYTVIALSETGCAAEVSFEVIASSPENPEIISSSGAFAVCDGQPLIMSVDGNWTSVTWELDGEPVGQTESAEVNGPGLLEVLVTDALGCSVQASVQVASGSSAMPMLTPEGPLTICPGESVVLVSDIPVSGWYLNGAPIAGGADTELETGAAGIYTAMGADTLCPAVSVPVMVIVSPAIGLSISVSDEAPCAGEWVELAASGAGIVNALWTTGEQELLISADTGGEYGLTVQNADGCEETSSVALVFTPTPLASAGPDGYNNCGNGVVLMASASGGAVSWFPEDGLDDPTAEQPFASPPVTTTYTLTVSNGVCSATDEVTVVSDCSSLRVPNIFSPNGDGANDTFEVVAGGVRDFELRIFNRWGHLVFESDDPGRMWDGTSEGRNVPGGSYFYTLKAIDFGGRDLAAEAHASGYVTVIR
jgi:gliding motility-associated-like protein